MAQTVGREPACGREVKTAEAGGRSRCGEWEYAFCSTRCKEDFDADPVRYLLKK